MTSPRYLFFTGKGGVGKTSLAAARAVEAADAGQRVLIVSTDPASNLDEVFGMDLGPVPQEVNGAPGLWAANLDPEAAAAAYRERMVAPYRGKLPPAVIRSMEEKFSGACTTEIAAFDEFVQFLTGDLPYDRIVFDTAPTGHTLRLLSLPSAWAGYLDTTTADASCLGPLAGLQEKKDQYAEAFSRLKDPLQTEIILVARPEVSSLAEAARTQGELADLGLKNLRLMINAVYEPEATEDPVASAYRDRVRRALATIPESLHRLDGERIPLLPGNTSGLAALRMLSGASESPRGAARVERSSTREGLAPGRGDEFESLVDRLAEPGGGVILTMGKGGVGKTSVAHRVAWALAERGHRVHLTTTDPAGDLVESDSGRLRVSRIDPVREVAEYTEATLTRAAEHLDADGLELLREDLRSPCTEEIAVFRAFADAVAGGEDGFVVIDTAPTGHTILLMDATEAYHREVARTQSDAPESVRQLLPRLRDAGFTRVILVALPEPTPVHEAMRLRSDLQRAGIEPYAWVVNRCFSLTGTQEPLLKAKAEKETGPLDEVRETGVPMVCLPWTDRVETTVPDPAVTSLA